MDFSKRRILTFDALTISPHDSSRKLGREAINNRLQTLRVPYRILRTDDGYKIVSEEEDAYD